MTGEHPVWSAGGTDQASAGEASQLAGRQFDQGAGGAGNLAVGWDGP